MNDIQTQLMAYGELPLNIARGADRGDWEGQISPVPGSELSKLWNDPSSYPVGLIELNTDVLSEIFDGGRELSHVFENEFGLVIDNVQMNIVRDKRLGQRVMFTGTRQFESGYRRYQLTDSELRIHAGTQPGDDDSMVYRPFMDSQGKINWQLMRRVVTITEHHVPVPDTVPAYLNYLYKNLERTIEESLEADEYGELVGEDVDCNVEDVTEAFLDPALQHHPLGVYNFIPTDPSLIGWFLSIKAAIDNGALNYQDKGVEAVLEVVGQWGSQFAELSEPFVQQAMRSNPTLAREIAKQDREGSPMDEDEDEEQ